MKKARVGDGQSSRSASRFGKFGGELADRFSARRVALAGSALSVICTASLAIASPQMILLLQLGNGFGQGFGWPALLQLFGRWFDRGERDHVLGWWSTSYILGGFLASSLTMWLTIHTGAAARGGFEPAYLITSTILLLTALLFYFQTRGMPEPRTAEDAQQGYCISLVLFCRLLQPIFDISTKGVTVQDLIAVHTGPSAVTVIDRI